MNSEEDRKKKKVTFVEHEGISSDEEEDIGSDIEINPKKLKRAPSGDEDREPMIVEMGADSHNPMHKQLTVAELNREEMNQQLKLDFEGEIEKMLEEKAVEEKQMRETEADYPMSCTGNVSVSLFWEEKIYVLLQALQLFGFVMVAGYQEFPQTVRDDAYILFGLVGNYGYINDFEKMWTDHDYAFVYTVGCTLVLLLGILIVYLLYRWTILHKLKISGNFKITKYSFYIMFFLVFPFLVNTLPYGICTYTSSTETLTVYKCWDKSMQLPMLICAGFVGIFWLALALGFALHAADNSVHNNDIDHEEYIKKRELEYVFSLTLVWRTSMYFLFSGFRRSSGKYYHRYIYILYQVALVTLFSALGDNLELRYTCLIGLMFLFNLYISIKAPYRCFTTNCILILVNWGIFPNLVLAYMRSTDIRSALIMVDTHFSSFLLSLNLFIFLLALMLLGIFIALKIYWPVKMAHVRMVIHDYNYNTILLHLRQAQSIITELEPKRRFYFVNKEKFLLTMSHLQYDFRTAHKDNHYFWRIILEYLETFEQYAPQIMAEALLPHKRLEDNLGLLKRVLQRRYKEQILMRPQRRRVLLLLFVFRLLSVWHFGTTGLAKQLRRFEDGSYAESVTGSVSTVALNLPEFKDIRFRANAETMPRYKAYLVQEL